MKITLGPNAYAEWTPGSRTINYYRFITTETAGGWINYDCASFGYDKPDNMTTQLEALGVLLRHLEDMGVCEWCGTSECVHQTAPLPVYLVDADCQHPSLDDCGRTCHHLECPDCGLLIDTATDEEA